MRVVFWGTYDTGKPRVRILLRGLRENGIEVLECHSDIWGGVEDKSRITGLTAKLGMIAKWLLSYPLLILRYLRLPRHDAVIIGYLGHLDVLILWPFAKLRGVHMAWDVFLSLYNTVVEDRKLVGPRHPLAYLLFAWEWLACRAADLVLLDTRAHGDYFAKSFRISREKTEAVLVGAETEFFPPQAHPVHSNGSMERLTVLFYGQFIPLHGIETIVRAAQQLENEPIQWILIGQGQEDSKIRDMLDEHPLPNLNWMPWVPYRELVEWISRADICLGIFGDTAKAALVIPNKVFQIISSGKPLITRDSPAIRELLGPDIPGVFLVPPADADALVRALGDYSKRSHALTDQVLHRKVARSIEPAAVGRRLLDCIRSGNFLADLHFKSD